MRFSHAAVPSVKAGISATSIGTATWWKDVSWALPPSRGCTPILRFRAELEAAKAELAAVRAKGLKPTRDCQVETEALAYHSQPLNGDVEILQSWHGDYPVAQINLLPGEAAVNRASDSSTMPKPLRMLGMPSIQVKPFPENRL